jgi:malonyl-CoA O-methyltransferase
MAGEAGGVSSRKDRVRRAFDAAATTYDASAVVQRSIARRLAQHIAALTLPERPRILEIGCGTGLLSAELSARIGPARWTFTDLSPAMLLACRQRLGSLEEADFRVMDGEIPDLPERQFDLISASLAFQWFEDLPAALRRLSRLLAPGGTLAFATLAEDTLYEWRMAHESLHLQSGVPDLPSLEVLEEMRPAGLFGSLWDERVVHVETDGRAFARGLKEIGAGEPAEGRRPLSAAQMKRVLAAFESEGSAASYHVAYGLWGRPSVRGVFVTGTDTGVGKTVVSACLARAWDADYWKPVQTGLAEDISDTATVAILADLPRERQHPPLHSFDPPVSPHLAAAQAGVRIEITREHLPASERPIVVEGAGGALVPLSQDETMLDLMARLNLPVVLVAANRLGAINQTLLSLEAIRAQGLKLGGVILTGEPFGDNAAAIERHGRVRILAQLPQAERIDADQVATWAALMPSAEDLLG